MERTNLMPPGAGHLIRGGAIDIVLKVGADDSTQTSVFELTVVPGFDVGAHVHTAIEETFYVLEGSLNLQVGEEIGTGIGPGSFMFVPKGAAHRFWNDSHLPAKVLFTTSPPGHERYFEELAEILRQPGPPDGDAIRLLRARYDTAQLSALVYLPRKNADSNRFDARDSGQPRFCPLTLPSLGGSGRGGRGQRARLGGMAAAVSTL